MRIYLPTIKDKKINLDLFIHFFAFFSVLLIGADRWGVDIAGLNIRIDQFFILIFAILLFLKKDTTLHFNKTLLGFLAFSLLSVIFAFNKIRSVAFYCSIMYNTVFLFLGFYNYVKIYGIKTFIKLFRATCYVSAIIFLAQVIAGVFFDYELPFLPNYGVFNGAHRFSLWFYEPSYFATYLMFWLTISFVMLFFSKDFSYLIDLILVLGMLVLSTSSSGFIGIAASFAIVYLIWLIQGISLKKLAFLLAPFALLLIIRITLPATYNSFILRIFNQDLDSASGGRITAWKETFEVFKDNILLGVGPGNYGLYLGLGTGKVPSNVTLDLLATVGIFASFFFIWLNLSLIVKCVIKFIKNKKDYESILALACGLGLFVFLIVLQFNQGYLRLYHWLFLGVTEGVLYNKGKIDYTKNHTTL